MSQTLTSFGHARAILKLGLPLIGSHMAQIAISATDTVMLGWYSAEALAAVVLGSSSIFFALLIVGSGFAWAVMPMVAKAASEGDEVQIRRVTRMGFWLVLIFAAVVTPPMLWSAPWLVALGQDPGTAQLTQEYLRIAGLALGPGLLVMVLKGYLSALERTQVVLWVTIGAAVLNAGLNYVLIFGRLGMPELGIRGAALASLSLHLVSLVALVIYARRKLPEHDLFRRLWVPDWSAFRAVYRLGWPISVTSFAESGMFAASAMMMGAIGTLHLAAHGIALQMVAITFMVHVGLSQAATVRAGRALGLGDAAALKRGGAVAIALSAGFSLCTVVVFVTMPEVLIGAFLSPDEPARAEILGIGIALLFMAALFQFADGAQIMALGLLRGVQDTRVPMVIAALAYWGVGLPVGFVLGFYTPLAGVGIWAGLVVGLALAAMLLMWRFWGRRGWQARGLVRE
ncbi:MATE efflux family protein [Dinoroseobacter shibae DFL 12 = DSM 16493]|jgi:MATE family multidrug resistance protein|uniref:Multidrug-efflux transporter n=1 Tax=Dinoroseobacter shibae (strain DSM 16493 / NCIMB 14021 / DFL 12) TaxID=398580 RepID=A8LQV7_DINSH|nr:MULTISPECIES: MATE family efflux transporter [Dinoroseobacter]ABV92500.1 MATE efflux family protein [Dinoroseobacter shibae DFL 12 = DSM 16493]MDD9718238.1 MATE family efflux transporter [Dinoroseobacter sp. PD6]URF47444.1 MATE family efflux transporter [Dinoroseobacter shibae]URF51755.1 MATE family efflux transporter [Dinoroseobacter shibae]